MGAAEQYTKINYRIKNKPKPIEQLHSAIRTRHYSIKTEEAYTIFPKRKTLLTGRALRRILTIIMTLFIFNWLHATEQMFPFIAAGQNADGRIEIFYIKTDQTCCQRWQISPGGEWSEELPCFNFAKAVLMEQDIDGCINVFILGQDNRLFLKKQSSPSNGWIEPVEMDDQVNAVALLRDNGGYLHLFYTTLDSSLYHRQQALSDSAWSEKTKLADHANAVAAGQNQDGRLEIFYTDHENVLYHKWQNIPDSIWSEKNLFADNAIQFNVSQNSDGRLEVFFINNDHILYHRWQIAPNGGWDNENVFTVQAQSVVVGHNYDGRMEVFYTDLDNIIYHKWQFAPSSGWDEGKQFGWTATGMAVTINHSDCLETFYMDTKSILFHNWQLEPGLHWAGEYPLITMDQPLFTVDQFPEDPIYKTSHENWHVNDHCFIQGKDSTWNMFGIIWPDPGSDDTTFVNYFGHAAAANLNQNSWEELSPPFYEESYNDGKVLWAPHVIQHDDTYYMFYCGGGPVESYAIVLRTSEDLNDWSDPEILFRDGFQARDPMVRWCTDKNQWIMYYTATEYPAGGHHVVAYRTSEDLIHWSEREIAYTDFHEGAEYGPTESPFIVQRGDYHYLFIGPRPYDHPTEELPNWEHPGYDGTDVFRSDRWDHWENSDFVGHIPAHAPEITHDENGNWYISRAGILRGGLYLTRINWFDTLDSHVPDKESRQPTRRQDIQLYQNYPNPFNQETVVRFQVSVKDKVELTIYDILGQRVRTLVNSTLFPGDYSFEWDGKNNFGQNVVSGVYLYTLKTNNFEETKKMLFIR